MFSGEPFSLKLMDLLQKFDWEQCHIWNLYGPAETTIDSTYHWIDTQAELDSVPIGYPLPNYQCLIKDHFFQDVIINQEGELFVGGVGVFAGYLGRDDLTAKALVDIDGEMFYRTGDLVRLDNRGLLHYIGRKDHQVKLHGQRIELGEIERCLLNITSISACVVMKCDDDHLVAYVQSSSVSEDELRSHCQSHLPPHMVPSFFIILDKLPLNANGKIDRKSFPTRQVFHAARTDPTNLLQLTPLEVRLRDIFTEVFRGEVSDIDMAFGRLGGTSLDAMRIVHLIRQKVCSEMDVNLLFANPSIRQLAQAVEPLLSRHDDIGDKLIDILSEPDGKQLMPSLCIELVGILVLICHWLFPLALVYGSQCPLLLLLVPVWHLFSYVACARVLSGSRKAKNYLGVVYSWDYYRWLFLNNLWCLNTSFWLRHLVGTPFYNTYLRLCGAKIADDSHIYTTLIDTPWMIEVGKETFIGADVVFSSLSYRDYTFELHPIQIGSHCSIETGGVLYGSVKIEDNFYAQAMSSITGHISTPDHASSINNRSFSFTQSIYQLAALFCLLAIHGLLIYFVHFVYQSSCLTSLLSAPVSLALAWLLWTLMSLVIVILLLKFVVGSITPGHHSLSSYYYLRKLWLRQLIITSFRHALEVVPAYDDLASIILRWLGAHIDGDVKLAEFHHILRFPSNLLHIEQSVTTFGGVLLAPFYMTRDDLCYVDDIHLGRHTNLTNSCTILPGARLSSQQIVGSLSLVTRENDNGDYADCVLLGIPARQMPFTIPETVSLVDKIPYSRSQSIHIWLLVIFFFFIGKCLLITIYLAVPLIIALAIHVFFFCLLHHYSTMSTSTRSQLQFSEVVTHLRHLLHTFIFDFKLFIGSYLSGTQFLVILLRLLGARIGADVIIGDIDCLTDPHLASIGDHVRLYRHARVQVRQSSSRI